MICTLLQHDDIKPACVKLKAEFANPSKSCQRLQQHLWPQEQKNLRLWGWLFFVCALLRLLRIKEEAKLNGFLYEWENLWFRVLSIFLFLSFLFPFSSTFSVYFWFHCPISFFNFWREKKAALGKTTSKMRFWEECSFGICFYFWFIFDEWGGHGCWWVIILWQSHRDTMTVNRPRPCPVSWPTNLHNYNWATLDFFHRHMKIFFKLSIW